MPERGQGMPMGFLVLIEESQYDRHMRWTLARYLGAVLAVAVAFGLRVLLVPYTGTGAPYVVFFAAVLLTSVYAGLGPGLLCVALAAPLGAYVFVLRAGYSPVEAAGQAALFIVDGVLVAYLSHLISRSRRMADESSQALRRTQEELRKADRNKDEFLAMLSHELRNPLAAIRNSAYILMHAGSDVQAGQRAREIIDRQTSQLTHLVDDLLDVTRIARGKLQLRLEPTELGELTGRAIEDQRSLFDARGVVLESRVPTECLWIEGDASRLVQVIHNLLHNAAKFTPAAGRVEVSLEAEGKEAVLRVKDTGVGIEPEQLSRVFDPFFQGGTPGASEAGLGLGLALVKGVVQLHGGTVDASSSRTEGGSEFVVRLPLHVARDEPLAERVVQPAQTPPRRVLVIEDSSDVANALQGVLRLMHHNVRVAAEGASGIEMAREFHPDVVLCDLALPGLDGFEIARRMRADAQLRKTVLVALTGRVQPEDRKRAVEAGFVEYLAKPATMQELRRVLEASPSPSG